MKSLQHYIFLLSAFLISLMGFGVHQHDTLTMIAKADSLFQNKEYYEASLLYHKASYFSLSEKNKVLLLLKKTDCLKQTGAFNEAGQTLSKINLLSLSDTLIVLIKYQEGLCAYLAQDYSLAESHFLQTALFTSDSNLIFPTLPIYALTLNEINKWEEAKNKMAIYVSNTYSNTTVIKDSVLMRLDNLYEAKKHPKLKNPDKARLMSHILPGLGQCYAGYYKEGASSFLINASIVGGAVVGVVFHYYVTSIVLGNLLLGKFYLGNVNRAEFLTNKHNYSTCKKYNALLKENIVSYIIPIAFKK